MALQGPHDLLAEAEDHPIAGQWDQPDFARLARLETHRRAGGDVEPHAARLLPVEAQARIGLEEVVVRADLDRAIAGIGHFDGDLGSADIELDSAGLGNDFAWNHDVATGSVGGR